MQSTTSDELLNAGYELSRLIERIATEQADKQNIHAVARLVNASMSIQRTVQRIVRFEMPNN